MRMLFVNLPVRDLAATRAFYEALGLSVHEHFSDDGSVAVNLDDNIALMLHTRERFAEHVPGEIGDPAQATTVVNRLTVDDRREVDALVEKALAAGGREWLPTHEVGTAYTGSFADPDGNAWEITWFDRVSVIN
jgi:predicted lactoylglutathione lyase